MLICIGFVEINFIGQFQLFVLNEASTDAFTLIVEELEDHIIFTFKFTQIVFLIEEKLVEDRGYFFGFDELRVVFDDQI